MFALESNLFMSIPLVSLNHSGLGGVFGAQHEELFVRLELAVNATQLAHRLAMQVYPEVDVSKGIRFMDE